MRRLLATVSLLLTIEATWCSASQQASSRSQGLQLSYVTAGQQVSFQWLPPVQGSVSTGGRLVVLAAASNQERVEFSFNLAVLPTTGRALFEGWTDEGRSGARLRFEGERPFTVLVRLALDGQRLRCTLDTEQPVLAAFDAGTLQSRQPHRNFEIPYYSGRPVYFQSGWIADSYLDWSVSQATYLKENSAHYEPLTDGTHKRLHEQLVITAGRSFDAVLPPLSNAPSPYVDQLAGTTVIDIWTASHFSEIENALRKVTRYGRGNCAVIIHDWQRGGYDNMLPTHYPANSKLGGDGGLRGALSAAREFSCYVALHQNYVDYYPNAEGFTRQGAAVRSDQTLMPGWLNRTTGIQSFATRPDWFVRNATPQSEAIHRTYGTNASFIDVNSAVPPWFRADMDASRTGAGLFLPAARASEELWSLERRINRGPVFGEGLMHWFWSGFLDGVEAQPGAGFQPRGENTPLFVDFDLLRIHPLQVNHGMGMYSRWMAPGSKDTGLQSLDAYRMQEIAFGHSPYTGGDHWKTIWPFLMESGLVAPVAERYGGQPIETVRYQVNGRWVDSVAALQAQNWTRLRLVYKNGLSVVANSSVQPMQVDGRTLPQFGWIAQGGDLLAFTANEDGCLRDYAETPDTIFANARNAQDLKGGGSVADPKIVEFRALGARTALLTVDWEVLEGANGEHLTTFIHGVNSAGEKIEFQTDYEEFPGTETWLSGKRVHGRAIQLRLPANLQDGSYELKIGLYQPVTGLRLRLRGEDDGTLRYRVGRLKVASEGTRLSLERVDASIEGDARLNNSGRVLRFPTLKTDGMLLLKKEGLSWTARVFPWYRDVVVELNMHRFPVPPQIRCEGQAEAQKPHAKEGYWRLQVGQAPVCRWPVAVKR